VKTSSFEGADRKSQTGRSVTGKAGGDAAGHRPPHGILGGIATWFPSRRDRVEGARQQMRVLALMTDGPNRLLLQAAIAQKAGWCLTFADTASAIVFRRTSEVPPIIIFERQLFPDRWGGMVKLLAKNSPRPYVILLSPSVDANLWDELPRAGGSDILRDPINRDSVLDALERARQFWCNQQQVQVPVAGE